MPTIVVRAAENEDIKEIIEVATQAIMVSCTADHQNNPHIISGWLENKTVSTVEAWIASPDVHLIVAENSEAVQGVALISRRGHLSLTYVRPACQLSGAGRALIKAVEQWALALGCKRIYLDSTKTALDFYKRNGYRQGGTVSNVLGMRVYPMFKEWS